MGRLKDCKETRGEKGKPFFFLFTHRPPGSGGALSLVIPFTFKSITFCVRGLPYIIPNFFRIKKRTRQSNMNRRA